MALESEAVGQPGGEECLNTLGQISILIVETLFPDQLEILGVKGGGGCMGGGGSWEGGKSIPSRLCLDMGVALTISCLPYLSMEKVFKSDWGLSHHACCLALPNVFLSSTKDWIGGGCGLASQKLRGKGT